MNARLAMLACKGIHQGPWARPQGCEAGIKVSGSPIFVEYMLRGSSEHSRYELGEGRHPFHHDDCMKFRVVKEENDGIPTTVEVLFH